MLKVEDVAKHYSKDGETVPALDGVTLSIRPGEFVVAQGPSGCGKTTLLLTAGGLLAPDRGLVLIDDENPYTMGAEQRARLRGNKIGFVFQQFHLIPYLTVLENVMTPSLAVPNGKAREHAVEIIERLGLSKRSKHVPAELSTGERQRTALARALLNNPRFLLADEPTGNLDPDNASTVLSHIAEAAKSGVGVLVVTHDDLLKQHADRIIRLSAGKIV